MRKLLLWSIETSHPVQHLRQQWGVGLSRARPASRSELKLQRFPGTPAYLSPAAPASIIHALVLLAKPQLLQPSILGLIDEQSGHEGGRPVPSS